MQAIRIRKRAQTAIEYLVTYSWLIIIVLLVFVALSQLGLFSSNTFSPKAQPGSCQVYRPNGPGSTFMISLSGVCNGEKPQYVAKFNGLNSGVTVSPGVNVIGPMAFTAWVNPSIKAREGIVTQGPGGTLGGYEFTLSASGSSNVGLGLSCSTGWVQPYSSSQIPTLSWSFVAAVWDGSAISIYINGVLDSSQPETCTRVGSSTQTYFGEWTGGSNWFNGGLANIEIYNSSLSANEILSLYKGGVGGAPVKLQNLVGWWPLNGDTIDYSGNNKNGVASGLSYTAS